MGPGADTEKWAWLGVAGWEKAVGGGGGNMDVLELKSPWRSEWVGETGVLVSLLAGYRLWIGQYR